MPPFSRSVRTLIQRQRGEPQRIKVLQTLGGAAMQDAIDIKVLQTLSPERKRHGYRSAGVCPSRVFDPTEKRRLERSAGACPPRSPRRNEKRPQPGGHGRLLSRSMHGEGQALALRDRKRLDAWRGTGPRPTEKRRRFPTSE